MSDQHIRQTALDPKQSFIVQAPAGSGKTELLVQRLLVLLTQVNHPEEIIAITFTRKAASEMRERILHALERANDPRPPETTHHHTTWKLACRVLEHDAQQQWQLLQNPNRLRIQTIDALCAYLTQCMPVLSGYGSAPTISDDPIPIYRQAIEKLLKEWESQDNHTTHPLGLLLQHLDNHVDTLETLFIGMLAKREQWLPYVMQARQLSDRRQELETNLQAANQSILSRLSTTFPKDYQNRLLDLAHYAASQCQQSDIESPLEACLECTTFPKDDLKEKPIWLAFAYLLLRKDARLWRKRVDKTLGFPTPQTFSTPYDKQLAKENKAQMKALLAALMEHDDCLHAFQALMISPPVGYTDQQWEILQALLDCLPTLVAHLNLVFGQLGVADFAEIAIRAQHALGNECDPSELALKLDYQIKHLLIDEFQDTSISQFTLIEKMLAGFEGEDTRSVFLVGDPMQSIYRFRQAEVGLFLRAKAYGIGSVRLTSLALTQNFRSAQTIVDWINQTFQPIFPQAEDMALGAVCYHASSTLKNNTTSTVELIACQHAEEEAQIICDLIQKQPTEQSIAILVRARSHLIQITHALRHAQIEYQAVELEPLASHPIIQEALSLTRALLHLGDRIAWLSILRAPWCGLTLADLHALVHFPEKENLIWENLLEYPKNPNLSQDAQQRLELIVPILKQALQEKARYPLDHWVRTTWEALGADCCVTDHFSKEALFSYWQHLAHHIRGGRDLDIPHFEKQLNTLYAKQPSNQVKRIQIMTIHKAKGLEFDTVILPSLANSTANDNPSLLLWDERPTPQGQGAFLLAPIKSSSTSHDPTYSYLRSCEQQKQNHESIRLLYVAATRAKNRLYLLASLNKNEDDGWQAPVQSSLLAKLWPVCETAFVHKAMTNDSKTEIDTTALTRPLKRVQTVSVSAERLFRGSSVVGKPTLMLSIPTIQAQIGIFIHQLLQQIAIEGISLWNAQRVQNEKAYWPMRLRVLGLSEKDVDECIIKAEETILTTLKDPTGRWILEKTHTESACELELVSEFSGSPQTVVIDRTFIDKEGTRWIIDYKTTEGSSEPVTLETIPKRYYQQLDHYSKAMQGFGMSTPIRKALYYPQTSQFFELP